MSVPHGLAMPGAKGFPTVESILGPQLIGTVLSTALWGVSCVQTYDYFMTPNKDHLRQKLVVALLCILNTLDSLIVTHALYFYLVKNFANPSALLKTTWSFSSRTLLNAITSFVIRTMFARRIYLVSQKNVPLTLWIMGISTADLIGGTMVTVKSILGLNSEKLVSLRNILILSFSLGIASDVSVAVALIWLLYSVKTGISKSDSLVNVLMVYVVSTGLLAVVDISLGIIFYVVMPDNLVFFVFYLLFSKLYVSSYFASLNGRERLRRNQTGVVESISQLSHQNRQITVTTLDDDKLGFHHSDNAAVEQRTASQEVKKSSSPDGV